MLAVNPLPNGFFLNFNTIERIIKKKQKLGNTCVCFLSVYIHMYVCVCVLVTVIFQMMFQSNNKKINSILYFSNQIASNIKIKTHTHTQE